MTEKRTELQLTDQFWRLNNLYWITDKRGKEVKFKMNPEQLDYFNKLHTRNLILKSRQIGFTTAQLIIQLDAAIFSGAKCALIAHTEKVAKRLFREKVLFAYKRLPKQILDAMPADNSSSGELVFKNGGSIYLDVSFRGGTLTWLHISEFSAICAKYPEKAREIVTGAFEAVGTDCIITIESTAHGRQGYFYEYAKQAELMALSRKKLTQLDWKFFFYAWWRNPDYSLDVSDDGVVLPERLHDYFNSLENKHNIKLSWSQKVWYFKKEQDLHEDMKREYPSTSAEAFEQSTEGAYYDRQFKAIYEENRICAVPHDPSVSVHTIWDIGTNDMNFLWFVQKVEQRWHIIDCYANDGEGLQFYMSVLEDKRKELGYTYGTHIGPHDLEVREWGNDAKSRWQTAYDLGLVFEVADKLSVADGINAVRSILPLCWFDDAKTFEGYNALQAYRKEWDDKHGVWKKTPCHDENSHPADAFRYFAVSLRKLEEGYTGRPQAQPVRPVQLVGWT